MGPLSLSRRDWCSHFTSHTSVAMFLRAGYPLVCLKYKEKSRREREVDEGKELWTAPRAAAVSLAGRGNCFGSFG